MDSKTLPDWLTFDRALGELTGLPTNNHIGRSHYLEVTSANDVGADTFTLTVVEDSVHQSEADAGETPQPLKAIKCAPGSSVTRATVIVDANLDQLDLQSKLALLTRLGEHLQLPAELLRLLPVAGKPMFDASALVSGAGDVSEPASDGAFVEWEVGCGNVQAFHMPVLQRLEATSADGSMTQTLGHGVVGWHVTNNRPQVHHRLKRRARPNRRFRGETGSEAEVEGSGFWAEDETTTTPATTTRRRRTRPPKRTKTHGRHTHHTPTPTMPMTAAETTPASTAPPSTRP